MTTVGIYDVGDDVTVSAAYSIDGAAPDPAPAVTLTVRSPDGTLQTYEYSELGGLIVRTTTGAAATYSAVLTPDLAGVWGYAWVASGAFNERSEECFLVRTPEVA